MDEDQDRPGGLYVNETETARRLGVSADRWRMAKRVLEAQGLPKRDELMGGRYWPAVRAFFDRRHGLASPLAVRGAEPDWEENLDALAPGGLRAKRRRAPRSGG